MNKVEFVLKILSIDTASDICGVSILEDNNLIINLDNNIGRTHSENLMPMIQEAFNKSSFCLKDMDLISCDIGPGSFTGIRIGVATSKAFCDSLDIPCVGISSLEVLAYNIKDIVNENEYICSIIDCKNDNCYFALFEKKNGMFDTLIEPQAESISNILAILKSYCDDNFDGTTNDSNNILITFVGDGSKVYKNMIKETFSNGNFSDDNHNFLSSYSLGLAGLDKYNSEFTFAENEILPLYLKKPQAQRLLEEKK